MLRWGARERESERGRERAREGGEGVITDRFPASISIDEKWTDPGKSFGCCLCDRTNQCIDYGARETDRAGSQKHSDQRWTIATNTRALRWRAEFKHKAPHYIWTNA